ncbi:MAG: hypothetical protein JWN62_3901 [Acidimicrobiales bacterium]|nr:hypothetical protein [Acidimicrobiales bacterium]
MPQVIPPVPDRTDEFFWNGVARHRLLVQQCASCGLLRLPPVPMCGSCHATEWNEHEVSGTGTIYTWILSHHPSEPDASPRIVVLVQLAEGPRIVSNLVDVEPAEVRNEMAVTVCFREIDGVMLPLFQPAEDRR